MRLSAVLGFSALVSTLLLTGCSSFQTTASSSLGQGGAVQGRVHGGRQAIVGAHVYLMAANTSGYGGASVSLLDGIATGQADSIGAYVLTDAQGGFSISGDYGCTSTQQVYLLAVGGDAGAGNNSASSLMTVLGQCPTGSTNFGTAVPFISVNEVTTVAGAYALSGFMTDMVHVSSSGTALANIGIANAFVTAANLANIATGMANATTPAGNGTVPQAKINTLANILAACINSDGTVVSTPVATNCYTLFSNATSDGTSNGTQPTETVTAALNVAHNPGANVANLYALAPSVAAFQPVLSSVGDFTLAMNFTGGGITAPLSIAVDGFGNIWTSNDGKSVGGVVTGNSASKFAAGTGAALSPSGTGYTGGGIDLPFSIAIDASNNVWLGDVSSGGTTADAHLTKLASDGTPLSASGYNLGFVGSINSIAIDASGNPFVINSGRMQVIKVDGATGAVTPLALNNSGVSYSVAIEPSGAIWAASSLSGPGVNEFDTTGAIIFPGGVNQAYYGPPTGLKNPVCMAIDHAGNIWVGNEGLYDMTSPTSGLGTNGVAKFSSTGVLLSPPAFNISAAAGFDYGQAEAAMAIDGAGHVFIAHHQLFASQQSYPSWLSELNNDGSTITPSYADSSLLEPTGIAVDGSGNVWVTNLLSSSVTEFVGLATPVVTPIAAGVANNTLGTQP